MVQWLRFCAPSAGGLGLISGQELDRTYHYQEFECHKEDWRSWVPQVRPSTVKEIIEKKKKLLILKVTRDHLKSHTPTLPQEGNIGSEGSRDWQRSLKSAGGGARRWLWVSATNNRTEQSSKSNLDFWAVWKKVVLLDCESPSKYRVQEPRGLFSIQCQLRNQNAVLWVGRWHIMW